jgi:large repetitive protein
VPGTFVYSPAAGTILGAGVQTLSVTFTPSDSADYTPATAKAEIDVSKAAPTVVVSDGGGTYDGTPFAAVATVAGIDGAAGPRLEGVSPTLTYYAGDVAAGTPLSGPPTTAGTYTVVADFPDTADYISGLSRAATFTVAPAAPVVSLVSSTGSTTFGQPVTLTASVASDGPGEGIPTGEVTFYDGGSVLDTLPLDAAGQATLITGSLGPGDHSITAVYGGATDFVGGQCGAVSQSVVPSDTQVVLVTTPVRNRDQVTSLSLTAEVESLTPDAGVPTGTISFLMKGRRPLTVDLSGGQATLNLKPQRMRKQRLTVVYDGAAGYQSSSLVSHRLTTRSLEILARASLDSLAARGGGNGETLANV